MTFGVRLLRNGVVINTRDTFYQSTIDATLPVIFSFIDTGASTGSTTYKIQFKRSQTCTIGVSERTMVIHYAYR